MCTFLLLEKSHKLKSMHLRRLLMYIAIVALYIPTSFGQSRSISGVVTSATDQTPLSGVTVALKNGGEGTTSTDSNGRFSISANDSDVLVLSYIGYQTQEVKIGSRSTLQIALQIDNQSLEEVVVVGYGSLRKREVTGASTNINAEDFRQSAARNAMDLIQGKVAGLQVSRSSSNPNSGVALQLRGATSIEGTNSPLVIIDGIPGGNLDLLQQEDIESINVLKDGSAAAIYGTQANGGVILVTTKKGKPGETRFDYANYFLHDALRRKPNFMNADEYRQKISEGFISEDNDFGDNVDAISQLVNKENLSQYHTLSISGGGENNSFRASTYYRDLQGISHEGGRKEYGIRANFNGSGLNGKLTTQVNFITNINNANLLGGSGWEWAYSRNPTLPLKNDDGTWYYEPTSTNYVARLYEETSNRQQQTSSLAGTIGYEIIDNLKFSIFGSVQRNNWVDGGYASLTSEPSVENTVGALGRGSQSTELRYNYAFEPTLSYQTMIDNVHSINAVAGYSYRYDVNQGFNATNFGFANDVFEENNLGAGDQLIQGRAQIGSFKNDNKIIGFLGRLNYSYDGKYVIQGIFRRDGSTRFGANNKWANFGSISGRWNISQEAFLTDVSFLSDLGIRASYGVTGNQDIPNYRSLVTLGTGNNYIYPDGQWRQTYGPNRNPNPNLRWETKHETNIGVDFSFFEGRLGGAIDAYQRVTKDLLGNYTSQQPSFIRNEIFTNVGQISSRGIELTINAIPVRNENITWNVDFITSTNRNRLDTFSDDTFQADSRDFGSIGGYGALGNAIRTFEGSRLGQFYGKRFAGFAEDGSWLFYKRDGSAVPFDQINDSRTDLENTDLVFIGNAIPKYYVSLNNTVRYKNFDLRLFFTGRLGYDILNTSQISYGNQQTLPNNVLLDAFDRHGELQDTYMYSDYYLESGSHIAFNEATIGYTFNLNNPRIRNFRVYATASDIAVFTKYTGNDPQFVGDTGLGPGIDGRGPYPATRSFLFGVNIGF